MFLAISLSCTTLASGQVKQNSSQSIRRIYFVPVRARAKEQLVDRPGNIRIVYANGKDVPLTRNGRATDGHGRHYQIAANGRTAGWLEGEYLTRIYFASTKLMIFRAGRITAKIKGQFPFIEEWFFWKGDRYVALKSRGGHGPAMAELHDTTSGRLVAKVLAYKVNDSSGSWAQPFKE